MHSLVQKVWYVKTIINALKGIRKKISVAKTAPYADEQNWQMNTKKKKHWKVMHGFNWKSEHEHHQHRRRNEQKKTYIQIGIQKIEITARKKRSTNRVKLSNRSCSFLLSTLNLSWIECNRERQTAAQSFVVIAHPWYTQHKTKRSNEQRREEQKKNEHSIR